MFYDKKSFERFAVVGDRVTFFYKAKPRQGVVESIGRGWVTLKVGPNMFKSFSFERIQHLQNLSFGC